MSVKRRDGRNVYSYCLKRLVLLIMSGDFPNGGNFPSVPVARPRRPTSVEASRPVLPLYVVLQGQ